MSVEKNSIPVKPRIIYTPIAFLKQWLLIASQSGEVGWHGLVEVTGENEYKITDILVYPQTVTGATVNNTVEENAMWIDSLSDETRMKMRSHFHSHVNMACVPSPTDESDKATIVEQLLPDSYYIFMIWNKRLEFSADIYDTKNMVEWKTEDVSIEVEGIGNINEWLEKATEFVKEKVEVKTWTFKKVSSSLIQPTLAPVATSSGAVPSDRRWSNYWHDSV